MSSSRLASKGSENKRHRRTPKCPALLPLSEVSVVFLQPCSEHKQRRSGWKTTFHGTLGPPVDAASISYQELGIISKVSQGHPSGGPCFERVHLVELVSKFMEEKEARKSMTERNEVGRLLTRGSQISFSPKQSSITRSTNRRPGGQAATRKETPEHVRVLGACEHQSPLRRDLIAASQRPTTARPP